jgi:hypothetical protein
MKIYWGIGGIASAFLTSALDGGERSASCPRYLLYRRLGGPQSWAGHYGEKSLAFARN